MVARDFALWEQIAYGVLYGALVGLMIFQHIHNYRYATYRATGTYGPEWRRLSKADRIARWQRYCNEWRWYTRAS